MLIQTNELSGKALCYSVSMIEMPHLIWGETIGIHHASDQIVVPELPEPKCYSPFTSWGMCGPIIERENISVAGKDHLHDCWAAMNQYGGNMQNGPTPLIASMRCYVSSKLGDKVDVPEELA